VVEELDGGTGEDGLRDVEDHDLGLEGVRERYGRRWRTENAADAVHDIRTSS
jgi:hypothetical protein